jgi:hypothetical protein
METVLLIIEILTALAALLRVVLAIYREHKHKPGTILVPAA